jgi:hypothetical protein
MLISFNTPLTGTDPAGNTVQLTQADIAALSYTIFLDTVNPPVQKYAVPAANVQAATANADGSKRISVNAVTDLKLTLTNQATYYVAIEDQEGNAVSPESAVLTYQYIVKPGPVTNPTCA